MGDLALAHVGHHQSVGDLGSDQPKQQHIQDRMVVINILQKT